MTTPAAENPQPVPEHPAERMQSIHTDLDAFREDRRAFTKDSYRRYREARPTFSLGELSAEDRERLEWFDMTDLRDGDLFGSDPAFIETLPERAREGLTYAQERRLHDWRYGFKAKDIRQFLEDNPDIVRNFPDDMKQHMSWRQRRALEGLQNRQGRRGHLVLVGAEVQEPEDHERLPMPWDEGPEAEEQRTDNPFATMTLEDLAKIDVGYLDEKESEQFSARRQQLRDRAKIARIEAERAARQAKIPEAKTPESDSDDTERTGFRKFWKGVTDTAREMRSFVDKDAGTPEGIVGASSHTRATDIKPPKLKAPTEKTTGTWIESGDTTPVEFPGPLGKFLGNLESKAAQGQTPEAGEGLTPGLDYDNETGELTVNGLQRLKELKKELLLKGGWAVWNHAVTPVLLGIGKVAEAGHKMVTQPIPDAKPNERQRKFSKRRVGAILLGVSAAAATVGVITLVGTDSEHAQNVANSGNNFGLPGVDSVEPYPEAPVQFDTPGIDSIDPTFKASAPVEMPTKAPDFDTPGVDTVDTQAPKAPEVPQTPDMGDTPGVDTVTPPITEAVGSGDVLPKDSNIWNYSSHFLEQNGYKGTDAEVAALKNWILPKTGFTEETAHLMPSGFPMPKISVEDLKNILGH